MLLGPFSGIVFNRRKSPPSHTGSQGGETGTLGSGTPVYTRAAH